MPRKKALRIVGIIPARYRSARFPGKVVADIAGKPMVWWVYKRTNESKLINKVIVATDHNRVRKVLEELGCNLVMTSKKHQTGTDRVAEVAENIKADIVVNVQADEPLITPVAIDKLLKAMKSDSTIEVATLCRKAKSNKEIFNPNTVRVVMNKDGDALYFSRAPIPFNRDAESAHNWLGTGPYFQHIGIYAYRRKFLLELSKQPQTDLEKVEKLEQLRVLETGHRIRVVETDYEPVGVDVPTDIQKVERLINRNEEVYA